MSKRLLYLNGGAIVRILGISSRMVLYRIRARQWPKADYRLFNERLWSATAVERVLQEQLAEAQARLARFREACKSEAFDAQQLLGDGA